MDTLITTIGLAFLIAAAVGLGLVLIAVETFLTRRRHNDAAPVWHMVWTRKRHHAGGVVYGAAVLLLIVLFVADKGVDAETLVAFAGLALYMLGLLWVLNAWPFHEPSTNNSSGK